MSISLIFFISVFSSIVFLEFRVDENEIHQSDNTLAIKPDGFFREEVVNVFSILAIVIFGIWGILISLGIYNF